MLDVRADIKEVTRYLDRIQKKQIPFATKNTLNTLAFDSQRIIRKEIKRVFDRPTPYTQKATKVRKATKQKLWAEVWVKNKLDAGKGTSPEDYLLPQITGGMRKPKRFEAALRHIGILPAGWFAVPGQAATLDGYGNMSRGQIVQILSYFKAFGEQGYKANSTAKTRARLKRGSKRKRGRAYFAAIPGRERASHLQPGVYMRQYGGLGTALRPVLIFVRRPQYTSRLKFIQVQRKYALKNFKPIFSNEMRRALATAK